MIRINLLVDRDGDEHWMCLCGNTFEDKGFEESYGDRSEGIYTHVCLHCGRKFDEGTLEVVGVRLSRDLHNELIPREEFEQILQQGSGYYQKKYAGVLDGQSEAD